MITQGQFEDRLDRWGGALERWPPDAAAEAEALLAMSGAARASHLAMREIEVALRLPAAQGFAAERFAAVATRHPQARPARPVLRRAGWGAATAAALVLGILVGKANVGPMREDAPDRLLASALNVSAGSVDVD